MNGQGTRRAADGGAHANANIENEDEGPLAKVGRATERGDSAHGH